MAMPRSAATTLKALRASAEPATVTVRGLLIAAIDRPSIVSAMCWIASAEENTAAMRPVLCVSSWWVRAEMDDLDRGAQVENAGGFRRRDFADAMAEHRRRAEAAGAQRRRCRGLDAEDQRLRDAGERQPLGQRVAEHRVLQRPAGDLLEVAVGLVESGRGSSRC